MGVRRRLAAVAGLLLVLLPLEGMAHAFWLAPFPAAIETGGRVALDVRIGPQWPGASAPRQREWIRRFQVYDNLGTREVSGREGGLPAGHFKARASGAALVVMQTYASTIVLPGVEFEAYLREEGLDDARRFREDLGISGAQAREDFTRVAKTVVTVGESSRGFDRALGLPFEIVLLTDPLTTAPGQRVKVKLLLEGQPASGVRVKALSKDQPTRVVESRAAVDGQATLTLPQAGQWTFYAVHIQPARRGSSDWESTWASLTFEMPERNQ